MTHRALRNNVNHLLRRDRPSMTLCGRAVNGSGWKHNNDSTLKTCGQCLRKLEADQRKK